jgi:Uma2 family endonuclease
MAEAHETLAPWAEIVPDAEPMTVDDLLTLPDDGWQYELVDGRLVRMAGSGQRATMIAAILLGALIAFVRPRRLGVVTGADGVYKFDPVRETGLIPDVGFYVAARQSLIVDPNKPIPFAPGLAVEVASPSQSTGDLAAKAALYLAGGTRLVWVVWPDRRQVDVWHPGDTGPPATLGVGDTLAGEDVIPGFIHPVADIFAQ